MGDGGGTSVKPASKAAHFRVLRAWLYVQEAVGRNVQLSAEQLLRTAEVGAPPPAARAASSGTRALALLQQMLKSEAALDEQDAAVVCEAAQNAAATCFAETLDYGKAWDAAIASFKSYQTAKLAFAAHGSVARAGGGGVQPVPPSAPPGPSAAPAAAAGGASGAKPTVGTDGLQYPSRRQAKRAAAPGKGAAPMANPRGGKASGRGKGGGAPMLPGGYYPFPSGGLGGPAGWMFAPPPAGAPPGSVPPGGGFPLLMPPGGGPFPPPVLAPPPPAGPPPGGPSGGPQPPGKQACKYVSNGQACPWGAGCKFRAATPNHP